MKKKGKQIVNGELKSGASVLSSVKVVELVIAIVVANQRHNKPFVKIVMKENTTIIKTKERKQPNDIHQTTTFGTTQESD